MDYKKILDWLMARGILNKAAGTAPAEAPPPVNTDSSYLAQAVAAGANNQPRMAVPPAVDPALDPALAAVPMRRVPAGINALKGGRR